MDYCRLIYTNLTIVHKVRINNKRYIPSPQLDLKYTQLELDYDKLKSEKGSRASIVQEANADLLRELERYSGQLKDTLKENGELKTLYLQVCGPI